MIRSEIRDSIIRAIRDKFGEVDIPDFSVEAPENQEHGDYATNAALVLAKILKKPPMEIASEINDQLPRINYRTAVAPPGFINFYISENTLQAEFAEILKKKKKYGAGEKKKARINVEFVSANPTGPLTMANARGGFYGDVLANVLEKNGYDVTREYYINDAGNQVRLLGESILAAEGKTLPRDEYYKGEYIKKFAGKNAKEAVGILLREIKTSLAKAGIQFDVWFSEEKKLRKTGEFGKTLREFKTKGLVEKKDGATWFGDRVFVKSNGEPTYLLVDVSYLRNKIFGRKFDKAVIVVGADHHAEMEQVKKSATLLGIPEGKLNIIIIQLVRLVRGGKEFRMGKRTGEFVTMDELLNEVGLDAARYFFLEKSPDTHMDFDLDLAKERSVKNPACYIQYAHARTASIFRKAGLRKSDFPRKSDFQKLNAPEELTLIKKLVQFPEVVEDITRDYQAHRLTRYAYELARAFHNFYEKHRVISDDKKFTEARLALVKATQIVLQNTLGLLGISVPRRM